MNTCNICFLVEVRKIFIWNYVYILTHCRWNRLSHTLYWKSQISILGTSGYEIYSKRKKAKLFANSGDPDQMPHSAVCDLGLHCLPITFLQVSRLQWINITFLKLVDCLFPPLVVSS